MPAVLDRELTERQRAVLDGIARRLPLKAVAADLGISESRVNQHVKGLKDIYGVHNLSDLVDAWRSGGGETAAGDEGDPCRNPAWRIPQIGESAAGGDQQHRVGPGEFVLSDASLYAIEAPWMRSEPRVVPGVLDGPNAVLLRFAVIIGLAFGILAAIVLVVTASLSLSEAFEGSVQAAPEAS